MLTSIALAPTLVRGQTTDYQEPTWLLHTGDQDSLALVDSLLASGRIPAVPAGAFYYLTMVTRAGESLILFTAQSGSGTGYDVTEYGLIRRRDPSFPVVWRALDSYFEADPPEVGGREIAVETCLYIGPDPLIAYVVIPDTSAWTKDFMDSIGATWEGSPSPLQKPGIYRYSRKRHTLEWARSLSAALEAECRARHSRPN